MSTVDPTSLSNTQDYLCKHLKWKIDANFGSKTLLCSASLKFECLKDDASTLILDTRDLMVNNVQFHGETSSAKFQVGDNKGPFGKPWLLMFLQDCLKSTVLDVVIEYHTSPDASALQWLNPEQTAGKKEPYLFTQCQAIHARSIVPCQDTPSVKISYDAEVTVPKQLTALMSAVKGEETDCKDGRKVCHFEQQVPIPSYLIALVIGALESRKIGPRSHVWTEKEVIEAAAYEFAETEKFIEAAEVLVGKYVWGVYDLLILPPSFPYGGMENPCLTFCTPTLMAGDRSLTGVVAHEISHSWTGNLVTNRNWEHFWLNEGFTRFLEEKIIGLIQGEKMRQLRAIGGWKYLIDAVEKYGKDSPLTALVPRLEGVDPDDAFSSIPYEKGFAFLYYIESLVGGPDIFNVFLKSYIEKFKYLTVVTDDFKKYLYDYFSDKPEGKALSKIDWDSWLFKPGMPPVSVVDMYDASLVDASKALAERWVRAGSQDLKIFKKDDIKDFFPAQVIEFLSMLLLEPSFNKEKVEALGTAYSFGNSGNAEIRFRWLRLCARHNVTDQFEEVKKFLTEQGRMKYVRPLYSELFKNPNGKELAIKLFQEHRSFYHRICSTMIAKDLQLS